MRRMMKINWKRWQCCFCIRRAEFFNVHSKMMIYNSAMKKIYTLTKTLGRFRSGQGLPDHILLLSEKCWLIGIASVIYHCEFEQCFMVVWIPQVLNEIADQNQRGAEQKQQLKHLPEISETKLLSPGWPGQVGKFIVEHAGKGLWSHDPCSVLLRV